MLAASFDVARGEQGYIDREQESTRVLLNQEAKITADVYITARVYMCVCMYVYVRTGAYK